ncbi:DUF5996 family protein [Pontibacter sp. SGAir0037]|uniref:DUF5996 family protein n=1 Tax=Pontibacter sp. SGAir0037 TaxID=2571030 RepID=UPI0010CD0F6A|nr:DUF5996 family protein [Pontibacter sp. SGAir0037]QCR22530.1 hypothetical protein C1N53_09400 [Pontibacter sp. SGAir0037]
MKSSWPVLSYAEAKPTYETIHLWTQVVGKIKLSKMPWLNHSWHVTLQVTPTGLSTSGITDGNNHFQIDFDFVDHKLKIRNHLGQHRQFQLQGISVADFYKKVLQGLEELQIKAEINKTPCELIDSIPFDQDYTHNTYHAEHAAALHRALLEMQNVFQKFRAGFKGKCSPVHFFWGAADLAVTRFSGRRAPKHPGGVPNLPDWVAQEAYSHEVSSCGFWPGSEPVNYPAFYSYAYPEPAGFKEAPVEPEAAFYHPELGEFILPYDAVRQAEDPEKALLQFLHSTYSAAADLAEWDREALELDMSKP